MYPNPVTKIITLLFKISASISPKIHSGAPVVMKPVLNRLIFSEQCENWFLDSQERRNVCKSGGAHALRIIQICYPNPVIKIITLLFKISPSISPKIHSGAPNVHKFTKKNMHCLRNHNIFIAHKIH